MYIRTKRSVWCGSLCAVAMMALLLLGSAPVWAGGTTDAELRGYKGGLVEIGLQTGTTVRGVLYGFNSEHLELEVAKGRTAKLHRTRVKWLKAAPAGAGKSVLGAFPPDAALPISSGAPRETPRRPADSPPPRETPRATETPTTGAPTTSSLATPGRGAKTNGLVFELKLGGNLYTPTMVSGAHAQSPVSADALLGYKLGRFIIGMRLDLLLAESGEGDNASRYALVIFAPTLQIELMQSWPLSMYGTLSVDIGPGIEAPPSGAGDTQAIPVVGFRIGAGMRYFLHPRFALGAEAGFRGYWMLGDLDLGLVTIYGQASLLFIW